MRLLRLMPQPYGEGSYVLGIEDSFLLEIAGRWQVKYEDGKVVSVEPTDLAPDMIADGNACLPANPRSDWPR